MPFNITSIAMTYAMGNQPADFMIRLKNTKTLWLLSVAGTALWLGTASVSAQYNLAPGFVFVTNDDAITITSYVSSYITGPTGEVDVPASTNGYPVTGISTNAFSDGSPTCVVIPACVTNIGEGAFAFCPYLTNIFLEPGNQNYTNVGGVLFNLPMTVLVQYPAGLSSNSYVVPDTVTHIGTNAFDGCRQLSSVSLPNSVTSIGDGAFFYCSSLTNITIPDGVPYIGDYTFSFAGLTSISIPGSVTNIGRNAFESSSLARVNLNNGLASIGWGAFSSCAITSMVIPGTVTNLGEVIFYNCTQLTNIYFLGNAPTADSYTFTGDEQATAYYLPGASGWDSTLGDIPTAWWLPSIQTANNSAPAEGFGFNISWASGQRFVVEASSNLSTPDWQVLLTNTLATGTAYFSDTQWTNYPSRFYRVRAQ